MFLNRNWIHSAKESRKAAKLHHFAPMQILEGKTRKLAQQLEWCMAHRACAMASFLEILPECIHLEYPMSPANLAPNSRADEQSWQLTGKTCGPISS